MSRHRPLGALGVLLALLLMGPVSAGAQEITEAWVAGQLGGSRRSQRPAPGGGAGSGFPTLSLVLRYQPATGELTPASVNALRPLYDAVNSFAPAPFHIVCCVGLPAADASRLARQLVAQLSRWFTDRGRGGHVQFRVQASSVSGLPYVGQANTARLDVYQLP